MNKIKGSMKIESSLNNYMFLLLMDEDEFEDVDYDDLLILAVRITERTAKEYKRDFSFLNTRIMTYFIKNLENGKIYKVRFSYKATFKSDDFEILSIDEATMNDIEEDKISDSEDCLLHIINSNNDCVTSTYLLKVKEDAEYEIINYSGFHYWLEEVKDEEEY